MERRRFLQNAGIVGVLATGVAPAVHAQLPAIRWRLASSFPKTLDIIHGPAEIFSKKVGEATGGKFTISVHAAGELMPAFGRGGWRAAGHRRMRPYRPLLLLRQG